MTPEERLILSEFVDSPTYKALLIYLNEQLEGKTSGVLESVRSGDMQKAMRSVGEYDGMRKTIDIIEGIDRIKVKEKTKKENNEDDL